jgi:hypothetical protein
MRTIFFAAGISMCPDGALRKAATVARQQALSGVVRRDHLRVRCERALPVRLMRSREKTHPLTPLARERGPPRGHGYLPGAALRPAGETRACIQSNSRVRSVTK